MIKFLFDFDFFFYLIEGYKIIIFLDKFFSGE